jgi:signal transduction histidine kinase/CheY-like chemotaxis protein
VLLPVAWGLHVLGQLGPQSSERFAFSVAIEALACILSAYTADALQPIFWQRARRAHFRELLSRLLTLFSAVPALLILFWTVPSYVTEVRQQLVDNTRAQSEAIHARVTSYVQSHKKVIESLADHWQQARDNEDLSTWLATTKRQYPGFKTLFVTDATGKLQVTLPDLRGSEWRSARLDVSDRPYFKRIILTGQPYISRVFQGRGPGNKPVVVIGAPVKQSDGRIKGIVAGSLKLDSLASALDMASASQTVALVDDRHRFIAGKGPDALASLQAVPSDSPVEEALSRQEARHVFAHGRLAMRTDIEATPWKLIQIVPLDPAIDSLNTYTLTVGLLALLFVFGSRELATRLAGSVSGPLEQMSRIASSIRANVPVQSFDLEQGTAPKEVELLAQHLNRMLHDLDLARHRLQHSLAEKTEINERLEAHNRALDSLVQEKTSELLRAKEEAEELAQSRSAYLAAMSHEIRTPLGGLLGLVKLFDESNLEPEQKDQLQTIRRCGESLLNIVNGILDNARIDSGFMELDMHVIEPQMLVQETVRLYQSAAREKGITLHEEWDDAIAALPPIQGDPFRIKQVIGNLISNAIKFTRDGHIYVRIHLGQQEKNRIWLKYEVEDTGIGIPAEQIDRIFEPFSQAHSGIQKNYGGSGLGLTISRKLAVMMGGHLDIRSVARQGSVFVLSLPHQLVESPDNDQTPGDESDVLRGKKVLIAEDNSVNQKIIQSIVRNLGMDFAVASNGKDVLQQLREDHFDLILMDCQMPIMDGYTATRHIRASSERYAQIPIIAVTAHASPGDRERCLVAGMNDHIGKPYSLDRVRAVIFDQLNRQEDRDRQASG